MILLTRPQKSSSHIAKNLAKENITYIIQPLFSIVETSDIQPLKIELQAVLITSSSAIFALKKMAIKPDVLILAVGQKTASEIKRLGYKNVIKSNNSASSLFDLSLKITSNNKGLILYLSGKKITLDLAKELRNKNFEAKRIIVYETKEIDEFEDRTIYRIKNNNISEVWIYSQNTLRIFFKLLKKHNLLEYLSILEISCFSDKIAKLAQKIGFEKTKIIKTKC
ncbi:MAG: uroporphyrinogen-III synthase [Rickettsiales bacterium]|jgi:uroporphyrinogen-III synthase